MQNKYSTNAIVESALMGVIIAAIILITGYMPFIDILGSIILPIPVVIIYIRHDVKVAITSIVFGVILTSLLYNPIIALNSAISFTIIGLTLGFAIKENKKSSTILFYLIIASIISNMCTVMFTTLFIERTSLMSFINQTAEMINKNFQYSLKHIKDVYIQNGIKGEQLKVIDDISKNFNADTVLSMIPTCMIIVGIVSAYVNYALIRLILKRLKYEVAEVLPFKSFCISNLLGAFLIGIVGIGIILNAKNIPGGKYLFASSQMAAVLLFQLNGIAAFIYFFRVKRKSSKGKIALILFLTIIVLQMRNMYFIIGIIEMAMDFRKLDPYRIRKV